MRFARRRGARDLDSRYGITKRYILSVSEQLPHKNLVGLIEAFAIFREKHGNEYQLVIAGRAHSDYPEPHRKVWELSLSDVVVFTGHLPDDQLGPIYGSATMLVFPSLYEGFGLPILEAMVQGTPVIASNQASLPEIVGDAGVLVDPRHPQDIAAAMEKVIADPRRSEKLREKGLKRVKDFTWERTARTTLDIYRSLYH
jgi:glycosyltransferase involved in cell wall biosynthesis